MIKELYCKNFKIFREETTVPLSPLTVITGPNNSGKTSLLDLIRLLDTDDDRALYDINLSMGDHRNRAFEDLLCDPEAGGLEVGFRSTLDFKSDSFFPSLGGLSADGDPSCRFEIADDVYLISEFELLDGDYYLVSKDIFLSRKDESGTGRLLFSESHQFEDPEARIQEGPEQSTSEDSSKESSEESTSEDSSGDQSEKRSLADLVAEDAHHAGGQTSSPEIIRFGAPSEDGVIRSDEDSEHKWDQRSKLEASASGMHRERRQKKTLGRELEWTFHSALWELALQVLREYRQIQGDPLEDFSVGNYQFSESSGGANLAFSGSEVAGRPMSPLGSEPLQRMMGNLDNDPVSPPSWVPPHKESVWWNMLRKVIVPFIESVEKSSSAGGDHIPSFRAQPRRYYGPQDRLTELLRRYRQADKNRQDKVNHWLETFEIGTDLKVEKLGPNLFEAHVERNGGRRYLADLGSGSAQLLPLILSVSGGLQKRVLIEEPEANLHPDLQAQLADLFVELTNRGTQVIVETHSEYFVRRLQYLIAKGELDPERASIAYLDAQDLEDEASPNVREITIDKSGQLSEPFGSGFFDQSTNLMVDLFKYGKDN